MDSVKVVITSVTGMAQLAELFPHSGMLKIGNEWSFVAHEKGFNKTITDYVEPVVKVEVKNDVASVTISEKPSNSGKKKK